MNESKGGAVESRFALFDAGITDLAPELMGWYGAPGVDPAAGTTLFLIGKGFSVHDTRVVAGGRPARFRLLSREVMEVDVPPGVHTIGGALATEPQGCRPTAVAKELQPCRPTGLEACRFVAEPLPAPAEPLAGPAACAVDCNRREFVDVHLATPYGVTSHLLVPVARRGRGDDSLCMLAFADANALRLTFTVGKAAGTKTEVARLDEFFAADGDRLAIRAPDVFLPPARGVLQFVLRDESTGATAAEFSFDALAFDPRESAYVIAGGDLRNLVGDTSRPATDKTIRGALKPYLDALLAQGRLADDGDSLPFTLSATLVADGLRVPVAGSLTLTVTRRGKTVVESADAPALP